LQACSHSSGGSSTGQTSAPRLYPRLR
jgi:hypothetical protein